MDTALNITKNVGGGKARAKRRPFHGSKNKPKIGDRFLVVLLSPPTLRPSLYLPSLLLSFLAVSLAFQTCSRLFAPLSLSSECVRLDKSLSRLSGITFILPTSKVHPAQYR